MYDDNASNANIEMGLVTVLEYTQNQDIKNYSLALARIDFETDVDGSILSFTVLPRAYDNYEGNDSQIPRMTYNTFPHYKNYLLDAGFPFGQGATS